MVNFGLYLVTGHPLEHNIRIRWPATDPDPMGFCLDCMKDVDVRYIHPGWLDTAQLDIDLEDLVGTLDEQTEKYARGMVTSLVNAINNYGKAHVQQFREKVKTQVSKEYIKHKGYVMGMVVSMDGGTTKQVYDGYCRLAKEKDEEPKTYRRVQQLLAELEIDGLVKSEMLNRGKTGRSRCWEVV